MNPNFAGSDPIDILAGARRIADYVNSEGMSVGSYGVRGHCDHIGAVLADCTLQAGLNYAKVVRPRVDRILERFPNADTVYALTGIVEAGETADFLNWSHPLKASRFERMVYFVHDAGISDVNSLRVRLLEDQFCVCLQELHGVGPKTVDYMACIVGIESIAVDRHIRTFAKRAGIEGTDYNYLKWTFCYAADLLSVPRRDFDSWIWNRESSLNSKQLSLAF
ncbi:hypothetical protein [Asticcacaulis sp. YBE204]|uniref:hypothetical protein n=1 Tax=Asticcacaulis sp. YBE204 TaxID=1282363 RepID=UPI0003C3CD00|nr:hypothetical protein [Asticcacaulis sp. YBE204]ESQ79296.1 hypothetical protein AEYBE204_09815 [Asticcacaulis sp. YBE204]